MPKAKKGEKEGYEGRKKGKELEVRKDLEDSSESSWLKAGHTKHGNRLGWAGSDWQQAT